MFTCVKMCVRDQGFRVGCDEREIEGIERKKRFFFLKKIKSDLSFQVVDSSSRLSTSIRREEMNIISFAE